MFINLFLYFPIIYCSGQDYSDVTNEESVGDSSEQLWHSYVFDTGTGNREELHFSKVEINKNFPNTTDVYKWKTLPLHEEVAIIGLSSNFIILTYFNTENGSDSFIYKEELQIFPSGFCVFQKWNAKAQKMEGYVVIAAVSSENKYYIKWYIIHNRQLNFLWDWSFNKYISDIDIIKLNFESKLLLISHNYGDFNKTWAEIYNFNINDNLDIWLFQKIVLDDVPSSVTIFSDNDSAYLSASLPALNMVHIFKYSRLLCFYASDEKYFESHQKIFIKGLQSLLSFRVGFRWHLAVAGENSTIYQMREDSFFHNINNFNLKNHNSWLAVPTNTYREDVILLSNSLRGISIIAWTGNENFEVVENDWLKEVNDILLQESTVFYWNGHQNILMTTKSGSPLLFKLVIKIKPVTSTVILKLNAIVKEQNILQEKYAYQNKLIDELETIYANKLEKDEKSEMHKQMPSQTSLNIKLPLKSNISKSNLEILSFSKNYTEITDLVNKLKETMGFLIENIKDLKTKFETNTLVKDRDLKYSFLPKNFNNGITFYGNVLIKELSLSSLNSYNASQWCNDSFRKDNSKKINGIKTVEKLNVKNIIFKQIENISEHEIIFSDDPWEKENGNIISGDIQWEGSLHILTDFILLFENKITNKSVPNNSRIILSVPKNVFGNLYFKYLNVNEETYVQETVNSKPMILPVHFTSLDINYLGIANQARIEHANVKTKLEVDFLNGRNFSNLFRRILTKINKQMKQNESTNVFEVLSTDILQADNIAIHNPLKDLPLSYDQIYISPSNKSFIKDSIPKNFLKKNNFKNSISYNLARNIRVYENLEVNGLVSLDQINNVDWTLLNDTIKKEEKKIYFKSFKKFNNSLNVNKSRVFITMNGRSIGNILSKHSNQEFEFSQIFLKVKLIKSAVDSLWDDICIKCLNQSLVRKSVNEEYIYNITFGNKYLFFGNIVNTTEMFNFIRIEERKPFYSSKMLLDHNVLLKSLKISLLFTKGSIITNNKINNISLTQFNTLRVSIKSPEVIRRHVTFNNSSAIKNIHLQYINDNDVFSFINFGADNLVIEKLLKGKIGQIKKLLVKGHINTYYKFCRFNLSNIIENSVSITKLSFLNGNVAFENVIYFNNINVTDSISGISLKNLEKDIVFKHSNVFLSGPKYFFLIKVTSDMKTRSLNGHLIQEIVGFKSDLTVKSFVIINGNVIIQGNVSANGAIDQIILSDLFKKFSTQYNSYIFSGNLKFQNKLISIDDLTVGGTTQNTTFSFVINDLVTKKNNFYITGKKLFHGKVKHKENVISEGFVNGVNFSNFFHNILFINQRETLDGIIAIKEAAMKTLKVEDHFNSSMINNFDTHDWLEESISLDKYLIINGKKDFQEAYILKDIKVDFINGRLPSTTISLRTKQHIPCLVLFPRIYSSSDLSVEGFVNKKNLLNEFKDSVLLEDNQRVKGKILILKEFVVSENIFVNAIKKRITTNLITLYDGQVVKGEIEFHGLLTIKQLEHLNFLNNVEIRNWYQKSVLLNRKQTVFNSWNIEGKLKASQITGDGVFNTISLSKVSKNITETRAIAFKFKNETENDFKIQCSNIKEISKQFNQFPFLFHQFEISGVIETSTTIESVIHFKIININYLIISFLNDCLSKLYRWDKSILTFIYTRQINIGPVTKWLVAYQNNVTYLITSSLRNTITCEKNLKQGNIWVFNGDSDKYGHLLTTNAFIDITQENITSGIFFTLEESGALYKWTIIDNQTIFPKFLFNVGTGNYRFIDFTITKSLAVSNGKEIKQILDNDVTYINLTFPSGNIVPLSIGERTLAALLLKDKIVIFENIIEGKIFSVIHTYKPGSVLWMNFGLEKQAFLIIASNHKLIEVYEYKSVSGLIKKMSLHLFTSKLQSVALPSNQKHQLNRYIVGIQKKKIIFIETEMLGDYFEAFKSINCE